MNEGIFLFTVPCLLCTAFKIVKAHAPFISSGIHSGIYLPSHHMAGSRMVYSNDPALSSGDDDDDIPDDDTYPQSPSADLEEPVGDENYDENDFQQQQKRERQQRLRRKKQHQEQHQRMVDAAMRFEIYPNGHPKFLTKVSRLKIMKAQMHSASTMGYFEAGVKQPTQRLHVSEREVSRVQAALGWADEDDEDDDEDDDVARKVRQRRKTSSRAVIRRNPDGHASMLLESSKTLPEPVWDLGIEDTSTVVTLRLRSIVKNKPLPEFAEGDMITGISDPVKKRRRDGDDGDSDTDDDASEPSNRRKKKPEPRTRVYRVLAVFWGLRAYIHMMVNRDSKPVLRTKAEGNHCFLVCNLVKDS